MISPGTDASGSSLPSTAHFDLARVGHRGFDDDLAIELGGERRSPARSSAACFAFEMPTLDPRLAGLTNTGKPRLVDDALQDRRARRAASRASARPRSRRSAGPSPRTRASSPPCPCRPPTRARRRRRTARSPARAGPAPCRLRRTARAAPGTRRRATGRRRRALGAAIDRHQRARRRDARSRCASRPSAFEPLRRRARPASITSAAETSVGGRSASTQRPSFSMRIGTAS